MNWRRPYTWLWRCLTPWVRYYLRRRARKAPAYLAHWDERFGTAVHPRARGAIWIHAVSVGETRAAQPFVAALRARFPGVPLLVTQMTPTGRAAARDVFGDEAEIRYLPYDLPEAVASFLTHWQPKFGVLMETELWPNLIAACNAADVPLFLANARLSDKSFRGYRRIAGLIRPALAGLHAVAAQSQADADRLVALGARDVTVCGNIKFDMTRQPALLERGHGWRDAIGTRKVLVCASTREGEEALLLSAWQSVRTDALLVIVPRHPERFAEVAARAAEAGFAVQCRSDGQPVSAGTQVWIGDSMGEMQAYYALADLVFIGGSLLPLGGQNLIEAAHLGAPVLIGPSSFNFAQATALAVEAGAALQVTDAEEVVRQALRLLDDEDARAGMAAAALAFAGAHRGASERMADLVADRLGVFPVAGSVGQSGR